MKKVAVPISLAGSQLREVCCGCAFFNSTDEEYGVLLAFTKDGFECGDKAVHAVNPDQRHDHLQRLAAVGIDPVAAEQSGQPEVRINTEAYIRDGRFDQDRMLAAFERMASGKSKGRFPLGRICCWVVGDRSYVDDVVEFESRVNDVWLRHDDAVICAHYLGRFGGDTVIDIMRTHPMIIVGGILQRNPFFVPPEAFLPELRERRAMRTPSSSTPA
jgi:MEDS: MEthanogen/methylotroph, DcmR Sensory domain